MSRETPGLDVMRLDLGISLPIHVLPPSSMPTSKLTATRERQLAVRAPRLLVFAAGPILPSLRHVTARPARADICEATEEKKR